MNTRKMEWLIAGLIATAPVAAHHSFGTFLMNEDIELKGVVTKFDYVNPHSWLHIAVTGADGAKKEYKCEMRSATTLRRSGWTPEMFAAGTPLTVQGAPDRYDEHACYVTTLKFADGSSLDRYGQRLEAKPIEHPARTASGEPNIFGDWATEQRVMTDPRGLDGTLVPLSRARTFEPGGVPEGQREIAGARGTAEANSGGLDPRNRPAPRAAVALTEAGTKAMEALAAVPRNVRSCEAGSILSDWSGEGVNRITQGADTIKLQYERLGLERTIYMKLTAHPANITPSRAGHSIGKWENDVLVVDTVGFLPGTLTGTTPHSDKLHVVERFSLDPATMDLKRDYTAEDPAYFTETFARSDTVSPSAVGYAPEACEDLTPVVN